MKYIWIILVIVVAVIVIAYFLMKRKSDTSIVPQVIVNKLPASQNIIINKKPGEQWTNGELLQQGYTQSQIDSAAQTASNISLNFGGF